MRAFVKIVVIVSVAVILASLFLPDVIRIPARWPPRLPRFEMVHGRDSSQVAVAAMTAAPEPLVPKSDTMVAPPKSDPVPQQPATLAASPILDTAIAERRSKVARLPKKAAPKPRVRHAEETPPPETPEEAAWFQQEPTMTIVPVKVTTEVRLSSPTANDSAPPVPGNVPGQDWPIVCGVVVDSTGAAIEGASVEVDESVEAEHTDAKGRFCMPCPTHKLDLRVSATGRETVTYTVEVDGPTTQVRITLPPAR